MTQLINLKTMFQAQVKVRTTTMYRAKMDDSRLTYLFLYKNLLTLISLEFQFIASVLPNIYSTLYIPHQCFDFT